MMKKKKNIKEMMMMVDKNIEARIIKKIDEKINKSSKNIEKFIKERFDYYIDKRVNETFKSIKPSQIDKLYKQACEISETMVEASKIVKSRRKSSSNDDKGAK